MDEWRPGTVVTCSKPSSGAGVVWVETSLSLGQVTPGHKNGDRT